MHRSEVRCVFLLPDSFSKTGAPHLARRPSASRAIFVEESSLSHRDGGTAETMLPEGAIAPIYSRACAWPWAGVWPWACIICLHIGQLSMIFCILANI